MLELKRSMIETEEEMITSKRKISQFKEDLNLPELRELIKERSSSKEFQEALKNRDILRESLKVSQYEHDVAKGLIKDRSLSIQVGESSVRDISRKYRDIYERFQYTQARLDEYRSVTAYGADIYSQLKNAKDKDDGIFFEYSGETLGNLRNIGFFESNSEEWLAERTKGVGGSDVGPIMRVGAVEYRSVNLRRIKLSKLGQDDDQKRVDNRDPYFTAIGRGNAWEEMILQIFAEKNPDLRLGRCKYSWAGIDNPHRRANFDGLILDSDNNVEEILEVKTSSNANDWGDTTLGLDGVPENYKTQILWYASLANVKKGRIIVLIDDHDYREYSFFIDVELQKYIDRMYEATDAFWKTIQEEKSSNSNNLKEPKYRRTFGHLRNLSSVIEVYSLYSGEDTSKIKERILKENDLESEEDFENLLEDEIRSIVSELFALHNPNTSNIKFKGIDIETTAAAPRRGRIIETGIVNLEGDKTPEIVYQALHGVPQIVSGGPGIGFEEVHGLNPEILEGHTSFSDPEVQKEILEYLKDGTLVAHNASFEDRFLKINLDGYIEARESGEIKILDTRTLTSYLMPEAEDNSLQSFAEGNGIAYEGAHSAAVDAYMMMEALQRLRNNIYKNRGIFIPEEASKKDRLEAIQWAKNSDTYRN